MLTASQKAAADILASADAAFFVDHPDLAQKMFEARSEAIASRLSRKGLTSYRAGQFLKSVAGDPAAARWCREQKIAIRKAESTQPNSAGGVLIPNDLADVILSLLDHYGIVRAEAGVWPMTADNLTLTRSPATAWTTAWSAENGSANFSDVKFNAVTLSAKKLSAYAKVSSELMEDSVEALGRFFLIGMAQAFAKTEDGAAFGGDGTSAYAGMRGISFLLADGAHTAGKVTAASGHTGYTTIDATDIGSAIAALPARAMANAKIYISVAGYGAALVRLAGAAGGLVATIIDGELHANWHGLPIVFTQVLPSGTGSLAGQLLAVVGDLSQAIAFGARRDLALRMFTESSATELDQIMIRGTERLDLVCHDLGDNSAAGAAVGLFAAAD